MKPLLFILAVLLMTVIPASAYLTPSNVTAVDAGVYSGALGNVIDGNTATEVVLNSAGGSVKLNYPNAGYNLTSCSVYYGDGSATKTYGFCEVGGSVGTKCQDPAWQLTAYKNAWTTKTFPSTLSLTSSFLRMGEADGAWFGTAEVRCTGYNFTYTDFGTPGFTGYPLDGYSPLEVSFTVSNMTSVNASGLSWAWGDGQTQTSTASTINHTYQNPGIYTVSMQYYNLTGSSDTITKTNYVLASLASGMIVNLDVKNAITGALIQDSTVSIQNISSGVWRNTTAPTGLVYFSTTDPGYLYPLSQNQNITLAANKSGYNAASVTFAIPYNNYRARLFLMPTSVTNATGAGTVVVNVVRNKDGLTVSGMSVVADSGQIGVTNSAGAITLYNVTAGNRVVKVTDPDGAYQDTEKSFSLTAGETKLIVVQVVLKGESPVDVPVTPTTTGTFNPSDPSSYGQYGNYTAPQMNEAGGFVILQMLGQLFSLWPLVVLGIFLKFMKSAFT